MRRLLRRRPPGAELSQSSRPGFRPCADVHADARRGNWWENPAAIDGSNGCQSASSPPGGVRPGHPGPLPGVPRATHPGHPGRNPLRLPQTRAVAPLRARARRGRAGSSTSGRRRAWPRTPSGSTAAAAPPTGRRRAGPGRPRRMGTPSPGTTGWARYADPLDVDPDAALRAHGGGDVPGAVRPAHVERDPDGAVARGRPHRTWGRSARGTPRPQEGGPLGHQDPCQQPGGEEVACRRLVAERVVPSLLRRRRASHAGARAPCPAGPARGCQDDMTPAMVGTARRVCRPARAGVTPSLAREDVSSALMQATTVRVLGLSLIHPRLAQRAEPNRPPPSPVVGGFTCRRRCRGLGQWRPGRRGPPDRCWCGRSSGTDPWRLQGLVTARATPFGYPTAHVATHG